jgi:tRNA A37 threonylcarbamoyladenosine dehydratase
VERVTLNLEEALIAKGYSLEHSEILTSRFSGMERIYGVEGLLKLLDSHVMVIGVGGVGSWTVEALARSGIGKITLVDLDDVCVSNINRQLPALSNTIGRSKISVLADRMLLINPLIKLHLVQDFYTSNSSEEILSRSVDYVVDAIDSLTNKALLVSTCIKKSIPVVTVGGAGGKVDPTCIRTCDLGETTVDPLLKQLRKRLRQTYGMSASEKYGISAVFSPERPNLPAVCATTKPKRLDCGTGYGSTSFVTGAFGFAAASLVVTQLAKNLN